MKHRIENGGIPVEVLQDQCNFLTGHLGCVLKSHRKGWHLVGYPGTNVGVFYLIEGVINIPSAMHMF